MKVTIGTEVIEGTVKELCEYFGADDKTKLASAIERYKKDKALEAEKPKTSRRSKKSNFME